MGKCAKRIFPYHIIIGERYGRESAKMQRDNDEAGNRRIIIHAIILVKLFLGRIIDGLTGGNYSVLFTYIADITEAEERARYFGMEGGFSGVGFILGPVIGGLLASISYILLGSIALITSPLLLVAGVILFAGSGGLVENALRSLISRAVGPRQQGMVSGASQSMQSLAMILGPIFGGVLYAQFGHASPYWSSTLIILMAAGSIILALPALHAQKG